MNKIILNNEEDINNIVIEEDTELVIRLSDIDKKINIVVEDNCFLNIVEISNNSNNIFDCVLKENSRVIYSKFGVNCNDTYNFKLDGEKSSVDFNNDIINFNNVECNIKVIHNNKSTSSEIYNKGINLSKNSLNISCDVIIPSDSDESFSNQINKVINTVGGKSVVLPNLIVDNKNVNASHSCYIGDCDKDDLFYLQSRGIRKKDCKKLLITGLLFDKMRLEEYKDEIIRIISGWKI